MPPVKAKRRYDSSRRQDQAMRTAATVLDSAERRFLRDGYSATTLAAVAADAGVSVATIYKTFGGKPGLVRAIRDRGLLGHSPPAAEERSDALQALEAHPLEVIRGWSALATEVAPRVAPILLLVRAAAATDPDMACLQADLDAERLTRMTHNARTLHTAGHLRDGVTLEQAAEVLWTCSSPELYDLLVLQRQWPLDRYGAFIADTIAAALLAPRSSKQ